MAFNWQRMAIVNEGREVEITDRDGNVAYINVFSNESKRARDWYAKQQRLDRNYNSTDYNAMLNTAIHLTAGWRGFVNVDGTEFEFSEANARKLYENCPDIFLTVFRFSNTKENYYSQD